MRHALLLLSLAAFAAPPRVAIVAPADLPPPARHGLDKLRAALAGRTMPADAVVTADIAPGAPESFTIKRGLHEGKPAIILTGGDARGLMYAALDVAERVLWAEPGADPFSRIRETAEKPFLAERGVSMYTMQRAYFESRLYDERYWQRYFDLLAASRINSFVIIFGYENGGFMAPLYPYFFNVPGFSEVTMTGLTPAQQERNAAAFRTLIRLAHERGIDVTAGIWDHIYRGGVQGGGIPGASANAGKRVPGLVWGVTTENLAPYTKAALARFLEVFPDIDAIQFRMHDESGLKPSEMGAFWHEVFALIRRVRPDLHLDLRAKGLPDEVINDALDQGLKARVSTKYWMEQMGLPYHPTHINPQNQSERRHGYADMLTYPQRYRMHWQLWTGGTVRLLLWGDPEYVRRFAQSVKLYDGNSFEVNEPLATRMLGEPHDAPVRDILNTRYRYYDYEFERYWHFYRVWGRVTYDPQAPEETWSTEFQRRFGAQAGTSLMTGLHLASQVLPRIVAAAYRYNYFPTTRGWAEMQRQDELAKFAQLEGSDTAQFQSPKDAAHAIITGAESALRRPQETADWFRRTSDGILAAVERAGPPANNEFRSTATDLRILAGLARYYAERLPAAVSYNLWLESKSPRYYNEALAQERRAIDAWAQIVEAAGDVYRDDQAFGAHAVGFPRHWKEELSKLDSEYRKMLPAVTLETGRDLIITARVSYPQGVKSVRLRYRHLNQTEDYQTAEMTLDNGRYTARIPAAFIDAKRDLMYYVEVIDAAGQGRVFPDLDTGQPYVIVPVRR